LPEFKGKTVGVTVEEQKSVKTANGKVM
jgi:hypothetical protein